MISLQVGHSTNFKFQTVGWLNTGTPLDTLPYGVADSKRELFDKLAEQVTDFLRKTLGNEEIKVHVAVRHGTQDPTCLVFHEPPEEQMEKLRVAIKAMAA